MWALSFVKVGVKGMEEVGGGRGIGRGQWGGGSREQGGGVGCGGGREEGAGGLWKGEAGEGGRKGRGEGRGKNGNGAWSAVHWSIDGPCNLQHIGVIQLDRYGMSGDTAEGVDAPFKTIQ